MDDDDHDADAMFGRFLRSGVDGRDLFAGALGKVRLDESVLGLRTELEFPSAGAIARQALGAASELKPSRRRLIGATLGSGPIDGIEHLLRQRGHVERAMSGLGAADTILGGRSAIDAAIGALTMPHGIAGLDEVSGLKFGSLGSSLAASPELEGINKAMERAMRDLAGVSSFASLFDRSGFDLGGLDKLISGARDWRDALGDTSLRATLGAQFPELMPERRRMEPSDLAGAGLSRLGERHARDMARFDRLRDEMLDLRQPWVEVDDPGRSVSAYVDARALATAVEQGAPQSRAVVTAVRQQLGDAREIGPIPEAISADPILRSAFRLEIGYNADLSSLPPAIIASVFAGFGGGASRRFEADSEAIESAVHQRVRRLELRLRRFIERRMLAARGPKWSKQRVPGPTVTAWRARRQVDIDNGRTASRLFDYAGFEDYRAIIDQRDNWVEIFEPIFKVRSSVLETLRRLSLVRNPDAHSRIVTIEDFLDLHVEGRRLDAWMDAAD